MQSPDTLFVDLILPVPIPQLFTYRVPTSVADLMQLGLRVVVEFGKNRILTAVVASIHGNPPTQYKAKYLLDVLEDKPSITEAQIWLMRWTAEYYMCHIGEVFQMALPAGLKISSLSKVQVNPDFEYFEHLDLEETLVMNYLKESDSLTYDEIARLLNKEEVSGILKKLVAKHAIIVFEEIAEKYKPKYEKKIRLCKIYEGTEEVLAVIESLEKNQKQLEVILQYLSKIPIQDLSHRNVLGIEKTEFLNSGISSSSLKTLINNGVLEEFRIQVSRFDYYENQPLKAISLSASQSLASDQIMEGFNEKNVVLFRGITGSGKTEIYIDIIQKALGSGVQVLLLLPEIALTTQIVSRLRKIFGKSIGVYHSKFSDNERVEVYKGVLDGTIQFVVGVRSAIFLPFQTLGLIIVDEEHESSYKQYEPAPRYHARDMAIVLGTKYDIKVLLGSATPSIESYYQALQKKYGLVELLERYGEATLPKIELINLIEERKKGTQKGDFSEPFLNKIKETLDAKLQSIIFLNRRGYAPYINCQECNYIAQCSQCAVSLTYHLYDRALKCHYCGHHEPAVTTCPSCGSPSIKTIGMGTEKIEDELRDEIPAANILRMDLDTTRGKNAYAEIIEQFESGDTDILVGTQMVSKGLDFEKVSFVGILNADKLINFPDFRSPERAFQLLTQVSGRAGRRGLEGTVMIQTNNPNNRILGYVLENNYLEFYSTEVADRNAYHYPPFTRLIEIVIKDQSQTLAHQAAAALAHSLKSSLGAERVLGPEKSLIERIRNKFQFEIWIKLEKEKVNMSAAKKFLAQEKINLLAEKKYKSVQIIFNVDAV